MYFLIILGRPGEHFSFSGSFLRRDVSQCSDEPGSEVVASGSHTWTLLGFVTSLVGRGIFKGVQVNQWLSDAEIPFRLETEQSLTGPQRLPDSLPFCG